MPVRRRFLEYGFTQIERFDDGVRTQVEFFFYDFDKCFVVHLARAVRIDEYGNGVGYTDSVRHLDFHFVRKPCRHKIFRDITTEIRRASVHFRRVFARKCTAAVGASAAVGIDDNFSTRQTTVPFRPADFKSARRVDVNLRIFVHKVRGYDFVNDKLFHIRADLFLGNDCVVLGGNDHRINTFCHSVHIFHRHLRFAVGTKIA